MAPAADMRCVLFVAVALAGCIAEPDLSQEEAAVQVCGGSIQAAIGAAPSGSVIGICSGTYREGLSIEGKRIELRGAGASTTIVDAGAGGRALVVRSSSGSTVTGLTLKNGSTTSTGGGIACRSSTLRIRDTVLSGNRGGGGGGLHAESCALDIARTRFDGNRAGEARGGGALLVSSSGAIASCTFAGNDAEEGGAIAVIGGTVAIDDNDVHDNSAHRGGGMFIGHDGRVRGNQVVDNEGRWTAGGIYVDATSPTIEGNLVEGNTSVNDGGGIYLHNGAAILVDNAFRANFAGDDGGGVRAFESTAHVERNVIEDNEAADSGGGVRVSHLPVTLVDNVITGNRAEQGGGLDLDNDSSVLRGGEVSRNQAGDGGGIAAGLGPWDGARFEDVLIEDNVATDRGGGLYLFDNYDPIAMRHLTVRGNRAAEGGGLYVRSTRHTLANSVFTGNVATGNGGAIHIAAGDGKPGAIDFLVSYGNTAPGGSGFHSESTSISVENSIFALNSGTQVKVRVAPAWRYNDTYPRGFTGMSDPTGSSGNLGADPRFADAAGGDFRLASGSPAIDGGDPDLRDVDGSRADMGAFGGPDGEAGEPPPPPPPPIDDVVLEADAHVMSSQPTTNFGSATTLVSDNDPLAEAYLRFRVTGAGAVTGAKLQLSVTNSTGDAPAVFAASSTWSEASITWNTRPARGAAVADLGAIGSGTVEYDVSSLITGDGVYTLVLVAETTDGFAAYAREGATPPRLVLSTGGPATAVLEADTYATAVSPTSSFGSASLLTTDADPLEESYLRFRVTGLTAPPRRVRLQMLCNDATSNGPSLHPVADNSWSESTLTWNNRPARGAAIGDLGAVSIGQLVEYDVTAQVTADGVYSFALAPTSSSGFGVSSREGSSPPRLIIEP